MPGSAASTIPGALPRIRRGQDRGCRARLCCRGIVAGSPSCGCWAILPTGRRKSPDERPWVRSAVRADSSEVSPQRYESSCAKPVRVAAAAPLCGRRRLMVAGVTVAVSWPRAGSPSPVNPAMTAARTATSQLQRRAAHRNPWFQVTGNRDVPAATALAMHPTVGCRIDPWRCCGLASDCAVANR